MWLLLMSLMLMLVKRYGNKAIVAKRIASLALIETHINDKRSDSRPQSLQETGRILNIKHKYHAYTINSYVDTQILDGENAGCKR
ncbi:hypothetical protein B0T22DRAFT_81708 [Podospora appendiculata]|uniref:Uncharacterized protein n=1 Tax=Podospora appendiculata TaxID=314037 RepID=A0AAE0XK67_9PEZI|nr:hypothetical protein B0T22DRAFT_81708 [Podospora appendiculata]